MKLIEFPILGSGKDETFKGVEIYVVAIFIGAGGAGMLINSLSITAELIGKNKTSSAFVYSSISLVDKIINGMNILSYDFNRGEKIVRLLINAVIL